MLGVEEIMKREPICSRLLSERQFAIELNLVISCIVETIFPTLIKGHDSAVAEICIQALVITLSAVRWDTKTGIQ